MDTAVEPMAAFRITFSTDTLSRMPKLLCLKLGAAHIAAQRRGDGQEMVEFSGTGHAGIVEHPAVLPLREHGIPGDRVRNGRN